MSTPQFFEIPSTGIYRSPDGSVSYYYAEGAIIPMALAIALGIEGAGYVDPPVFDPSERSAIEAEILAKLADTDSELYAAISALGGGGGASGSLQSIVPAVAASTNINICVFTIPVTGTIASLKFVPNADMGGDTNNWRKLEFRVVEPGTGGIGGNDIGELWTNTAQPIPKGSVNSIDLWNTTATTGHQFWFKDTGVGTGTSGGGLLLLDIEPS